MGTPDFAVPSLQTLLNSSNHQVVGVFTQKAKSHGRGLKVKESPISQLATLYQIPIYTPTTLKTQEVLSLIDGIDADIIVVVAYGFIIPSAILRSKKYGVLNVHPSLLPKYRGAAPLQRTIINGEIESGVCIMQMDEGLDTGDIILKKRCQLSNRITLSALSVQLSHMGAQMLLNVLDNIHSLTRTKQSDVGVSYAAKLNKSEGRIDWNDSAQAIDAKVRGMNPWPGTYFEYDNKIIKVLDAIYEDIKHQHKPGTVIIENNNDKTSVLKIACKSGMLNIFKLQQNGKNPLKASEFLKGFKF